MAMCAAIPSAQAADPVAVKVVQVIEERSIELPAMDDKLREMLRSEVTLEGQPRMMILRLELVGKPVETAFLMGKVKVTASKLDKGELKPAGKESFWGVYDELQPIPRIPDMEGLPPQPKDKASLAIDFPLPPRAATMITSLEGTITLMGGKSQELKFPGMARKQGKLNDKALEAAGLTIAVIKPPDAQGIGPGHAIAMEVTGDAQKILDVLLTDAKGEMLQAGAHLESPKDKKQVFVMFMDSEIPADTVVQITVVPKPELVEVPFKFSNIKLP